jgi:hypothetical protein
MFRTKATNKFYMNHNSTYCLGYHRYEVTKKQMADVVTGFVAQTPAPCGSLLSVLLGQREHAAYICCNLAYANVRMF